MNRVIVDLNSRSYAIDAGRGAFEGVLDLLGHSDSGERNICVADSSAAKLHPQKIAALKKAGVKVVLLPGGEKTKCWGNLEKLCSAFAAARLDRKSLVIALGGGVIGDLAGFAAAIYMRGIGLVQVPTTFLAMVDSSVGGKTAIDIDEGKNLVGAFHQPMAVFADSDFLDTLPKREISAGWAEVVKCSVLEGGTFFKRCSAMDLTEAVRRSCMLKAKIVSDDECECASSGGRALLNLGHTFAHAVEKCCGYGKYLHGEAVSIGLSFAAELSERLGAIKQAEVDAIKSRLAYRGLPVKLPDAPPTAELMRAMKGDKKCSAGNLRFVLIRGAGKAFTEFVDDSVVRAAVADFVK